MSVKESLGVKKLQEHLVHVKLKFAERELELLSRCKAAEDEVAQLQAEMEIAKDELQLCWSYVHQLKKENAVKFRFEERDDWKALVHSIQEDRQRLRRENKRLRQQCLQDTKNSDFDRDAPLSPDHSSILNQHTLLSTLPSQSEKSRFSRKSSASFFTTSFFNYWGFDSPSSQRHSSSSRSIAASKRKVHSTNGRGRKGVRGENASSLATTTVLII